MAIEEVRKTVCSKQIRSLILSKEFSIEIPDKEADSILSSKSLMKERIVWY